MLRREPQQLLKQYSFATVRPQIARVKQTGAIGFDQDCVGIVRRVIDEKGRDREWADVDRRAIFKMENPFQSQARRRENVRSSQNGLRGLPIKNVVSLGSRWASP